MYSYARGTTQQTPTTIDLEVGDASFLDSLAGGEAAIYIVRTSAARVGIPTDGPLTDAALAAY